MTAPTWAAAILWGLVATVGGIAMLSSMLAVKVDRPWGAFVLWLVVGVLVAAAVKGPAL